MIVNIVWRRSRYDGQVRAALVRNAGDGRYALLAVTGRDRQQPVAVSPVDATALGTKLSEL